ncbi:glycosyltransferase family 2 protein [Candidatus Woesebacteria bacterium]|nr:glycosyltransferase family 2 protein [Candidatus Woesebacteria bacterium]
MKTTTCKLSVVLAIYNEAANLARCLESVADIADEIIVVDGNSTDDSVKIAQSFQAKIFSTTNKANFHINKQKAIDAGQGQLILQLDADEVVSDQLVEFISKIKQQPAKYQTFSAWWLIRRNYFLGEWLKKGGQYPDPVIRLFWRGKAKLPQKDVHEQMSVRGMVGWADGYLEHYSNPTLTEYLRKMNTYTSFKAQQLYQEKINPTVVNTLLYFFYYPPRTFFSLFLRHKGIFDGWAGFLFALLSSIHYPIQYLKLWELHEKSRLAN